MMSYQLYRHIRMKIEYLLVSKNKGVKWKDGHTVVDVDITRNDRDCSCCGLAKPLLEFSKNKLVRDGYNYQCKACIAIAKADWKSRNLESYLSSGRNYSKRYRLEKSEKCKEDYASWAKANRAYLNNRDADRRAKKLQATVIWANESIIKSIYKEAHARSVKYGIDYQVDHIVPLISDDVCGLHCEHNLRIITKSENSSKGNRYWPDMPEELKSIHE